MRESARRFFADLHDQICLALERLDGGAQFREDHWQRGGGGGGRTRVMEAGALFEKAGVNLAHVHGSLGPSFAAKLPLGEGLEFFATGVSLVLHPLNPFVPTVHANFRYLERGSSGWFGGGADLTPCYPFIEDVAHFHGVLRDACDRFDPAFYGRFKSWCDEYFYIKHRNEARGVGGIFFDYLTGGLSVDERSSTDCGIERIFKFVCEVGRSFLPAYMPIAERRRTEPYGGREREFQLIRRGRYVEFNLVYDRGTQFGLETGGRAESTLMSLPPLARWAYDYRPEPGSREAEALTYFQRHDWLGGT
jgi:coproporphyrinogen III oxidase